MEVFTMWMTGIFHRPIGVATAIAVAALFSLPSLAADIRVPGDYSTIQDAIDAAVVGDRILLGDGVFRGEGNRDLDLLGKSITVKSAHGPVFCAIDCEGSEAGQHRAFDLSRNESRATVISGLTIMGGSVAGPYDEDDGGGIRLRGSSPSIVGCSFSGNSSGGAGGAIACLQLSNPLIEHCSFLQNFGFDGGGAIGCDASSPVIRVCEFYRNGVYNAGGAISCYRGSSPEITGNMFKDNAADLGGGIYCELNSSPLIEGNRFTENSCVWYGGGILCNNGSAPQIRNNLLDHNYAGSGGGISVTYNSSAVIENCTFSSNTGGSIGGAVYLSESLVTITGCILWGNQSEFGDAIALRSTYGPSVATLTWTDLQGGDNAVHIDGGSSINYGPGMISADPLFVTGPDDPCYLSQVAAGQRADSPCLDAGDPASIPPVGTTRTDHWPDRGTGDLGYHREADWTAACDLDGSGRVDGGDLSILARAWGASDGEPRYDPRADINGSGVVDGDDLALLASVFGERG
jgi:predicted outer membrane repeat protein